MSFQYVTIIKMEGHMTEKNQEVEMNETAKLVLENIQKYIKQNKEGYRFVKDLTMQPEIAKEIGDAQWAVIIDQAWRMAYIKAIDDSFISNEERADLNNIRQLQNFYQLRISNRQVINHKLNKGVKKVVEQNPEPPKQVSKNSPYYIPKPWDYPTLKMRDEKDKK